MHTFLIDVRTVDTTAHVQLSSLLQALKTRSRRLQDSLDFNFTEFSRNTLVARLGRMEPERGATPQVRYPLLPQHTMSLSLPFRVHPLPHKAEARTHRTPCRPPSWLTLFAHVLEQLALDVVDHELPFSSLFAVTKAGDVSIQAVIESSHTLQSVVAYDHYLKIKRLSEEHVATIKAEFLNLKRFVTALGKIEEVVPGVYAQYNHCSARPLTLDSQSPTSPHARDPTGPHHYTP